jgi:hypothetical protein
MRRIGDASFFRIVDRLFGAGATPLNAARWTIDGVDWRRERHNYSGDSHGFTVEVTTGTSARKPSWNLIIVKEYWRKAEAGEGFKTLQWAQVTSGRRADVDAWLRRQERILDR